MAGQRDLLTDDFKESIDWHLARGHRLIRLHKAASKKAKIPIDEGWRDSEGLTRRQAYAAVRDGHNIGWAPTGEHLILDVDMHGDHDGIETYEKLLEDGLLPPEDELPRVESSNGGFHIYLRKPYDQPVSTTRLKKEYGRGVDVIANQQIVIPASIHPATGEPYEFVNMPDDIPDWPPALEDLLKRRKKKKETPKNVDDLPDIDAVEQLLTAIKNDDDKDNDYDEWFAVLCMVHESTGGSEEGRELVHHWSGQNPLYDADYTDAKWESIDSDQYGGDAAGFGSLVYLAKEHDPQLVANVVNSVRFVSAQEDFADLPPPQKDFNIKKTAWRLVEEELSYDDIKPDEWIYQDVLPLGAYAAMAGRQGLGKSTLLMHLAACVTNGKPFPGDDDNPLDRKPGDVLYFSVEERIQQSILPKLQLSGADLKRIHVFRAGMTKTGRSGESTQKGFSVTDGLKELETQLLKYPDTRLVIFDPITMFIIHNQSSDSHNTVVMNQSLAPLNKLAEDHDLCILGITHFNKQGGKGLEKVTGSIAHTTVARHVTFLLPHFVDNHTVLATQKSNMFTDHRSYVFEGVQLEDEFIEGYETPLKRRQIHLLERNEENLNADDWERIVAERTQDDRRRSAVDHLADQIREHITDNSMQRRFWTSRTFKDYFRAKYAQHNRTFDECIAYMVEENQLVQENVNGTWYIWYIDGLIADDPEELHTFNESMRDQIRGEVGTAKTALQQAIIDFVEEGFPEQYTYDDLYNHFLDYSETQISKAVRILAREGKVEREHIKRKYYIGAVA